MRRLWRRIRALDERDFPYDIDSTLVLGRDRWGLGVETVRLLRLESRIPGARSQTAGEP